MGQKIVFDSEDCQNAANKNRPQQERNPNVNRLSFCVLQEKKMERIVSPYITKTNPSPI